MTTLIKVKNKDEYLKSIDTRNGKIEYTNDKSQVKVYTDMWFSDTEIDFIKFHFKDKYPNIADLQEDTSY